ncbi:mannitol dehydrogenase family protein [Alteromonas sp. 5E99-2]|uniref:mannitol dehydrogenase family protein n=1 Tax=Alteromonas sp. 5E99-2 TaxID=2817683 RepID=UPI00325B4C15
MRLNTKNLSLLAKDVITPKYNKNDINSAIVHFGVGNFHRAHQAVYSDDLLNLGEKKWGITGVSLRSSSMRDKLKPQDYLYTQPTLGLSTEYRIIGALTEILVAPENPTAVINAVANARTQLVTLTITEKGYYVKDGNVDTNHADICHDLNNIDTPKTVFGYLAAALIQRASSNSKAITILCCDNMNGGGEYLHQGVQCLLEKHSPDTLSWVKTKVSFSASMVDRVTPATNEKLLHQVSNHTQLDDAAPVAAEPFSQWVIEDNFAGERPPFDKVGALFVKAIAPYEQVKLRFLNASHSILATLGYLLGDTYVHETLQRNTLAQFTEQAIKQDVLPITHVPDDINGSDYIDQVFERFHNANLPYACLQVGSDSSQKIQQRWLPSIDDALAQNKQPRHLAFALAAWVVYIRKALENGDLSDPLNAEFSHYLPASPNNDIQHFLSLAGGQHFQYFTHLGFMNQVEGYHAHILEAGVEQALNTFMTQ